MNSCQDIANKEDKLLTGFTRVFYKSLFFLSVSQRTEHSARHTTAAGSDFDH